MHRLRHYVLPLLACLLLGSCVVGPQKEVVSFADDVRPILKTRCMSCHGGVRQLGGLSFLFEEDLYRELRSGARALVPGDPEHSEIYRRITTDRPGLVMPPEGPTLTAEETDIIRRWIEQGGGWEEHWAYRVPTRPGVPTNRHGIDHFVQLTLDSLHLRAAAREKPRRLLRRLYLDLIGLPPSPEALQKFAADPSEEAYLRTVDSLLASPHFGERWASMWLDLARYADSQGYQKDLLRRTIWLYRDWVIEAFNRDMPLDSFTIRQLAGDLLDEPTEQDLLATAFHRNTMTNDEGGTDDEEFRVRAVLDRTNTTMEVWQGATFGCVQCHSHPYDPVRHEEFYAVKGYFNNTADADLSNDYPRVELLSAAQRRRIEEYETDIQPQPVPVMQELPPDSSRVNQLFVRGNWLMQADTVPPGVPAAYDKPGEEFRPDRLGLARWLVHDDNPLTARVLANRIWAQLFGRGIVLTLEDFGIMGAEPTHPELLDWLALELSQTHDWQLKGFLRTIVTSETYRQNSAIDSVGLATDPDNRWLARGPRFRLSAEQIRDQALAASGLLNPEMYGPSVMPYQPEGVWNVIRHAARWEKSPGEQAYRRALYTFHRRVSPYPTQMLFDAPNRELCVSRRVLTNTPLQAMVTLNDPVFVEAAAALADLAREAHPDSTEAQIALAYERATCREADADTRSRLVKLYRENFRELDDERAALASVCRALLNLDIVLTKT